MILTSFTSSEKVCWRDTGWCSVKCGILSSCDSLLIPWCDIGCPSPTAAVSRLMRPKTDTLVLPPSHLLEPSLPSLILQQALCNTLPLLMLNVGGAKTRKIGSFPTHHTAARQIAFRKPVSPRIRLGPTSPECPSRFPCFFSFIFVTLIFVMKYSRLGMS